MDENNDYEEDILPEPEENVPLKKKRQKMKRILMNNRKDLKLFLMDYWLI